MIPKTIHYCWFGKAPLPQQAIACMESWVRLNPSFKVKRWDEENFDVGSMKYTAKAYEDGNYAFVSDVVRLHALIQEGGIYLDVDVEALRSFDSLLQSADVILGREDLNFVATSTMLAKPNSDLLKKFYEYYSSWGHDSQISEPPFTTNVRILDDLLVSIGLQKREDAEQTLQFGSEKILVKPSIAFSPFSYSKLFDRRDSTSFAVHHFAFSWASPSVKFRRKVKQGIKRLLGRRFM